MDQTTDEAYAGFDATFVIDLSDAVDVGVDLVGKKVIFSLKKDRKAADSDAVLTNDFTVGAGNLDPDNNKAILVQFPASQMLGIEEATYSYDCKIFNEDGSGLVYIPHQEITIIDDVSNRVPA